MVLIWTLIRIHRLGIFGCNIDDLSISLTRLREYQGFPKIVGLGQHRSPWCKWKDFIDFHSSLWDKKMMVWNGGVSATAKNWWGGLVAIWRCYFWGSFGIIGWMEKEWPNSSAGNLNQSTKSLSGDSQWQIWSLGELNIDDLLHELRIGNEGGGHLHALCAKGRIMRLRLCCSGTGTDSND